MNAIADLTAIVRHCATDFLDTRYDMDAEPGDIAALLYAAVRAEVCIEGAIELRRIADETEARVAEHYGTASGIGPGSAELVREAARTLRSMAGEKSSRDAATATPADTNRRARLLHEIALDDRRWTSGDVVRWYRVNGHAGLGLRAARFDLAVLRDSGALIQHEEKSGRSFTHNSPKGGA